MLEKNRRHHPDVNGHYGYLSDLLGKPDRVRRNRRDAQILIFYKVVDTERGRRALRAAVVFPPDLAEGKLPSILSFRWAEKKAERRRELGMEKSFAGRLPTPGVSFGP